MCVTDRTYRESYIFDFTWTSSVWIFAITRMIVKCNSDEAQSIWWKESFEKCSHWTSFRLAYIWFLLRSRNFQNIFFKATWSPWIFLMIFGHVLIMFDCVDECFFYGCISVLTYFVDYYTASWNLSRSKYSADNLFTSTNSKIMNVFKYRHIFKEWKSERE